MQLNKKNFCYSTWLLSEIAERKKKNSNFSLRSLARNIGLSPSHLSNIINKKRPMTLGTARIIAESLDITKAEKDVFFASIDKDWKSYKKKPLKYININQDEFKLVDEWYHFAILSLGEKRGNKLSPEWISDRLAISREEAARSLTNLLSLGYIEATNSGGYRSINRPILKSKRATGEDMQKFHRQVLRKSEEKLLNEEAKNCFFSFRAHGIKLEALPLIKNKIREQQQELTALIRANKDNQEGIIFAINTQVVPLEKIGENV